MRSLGSPLYEGSSGLSTLHSRQLAAACSSWLGMSYDKHATSSSAWRYRHIPVNRATGTGRREKSRSPQQTSMRWSSASTPGSLKKRPACGCPSPLRYCRAMSNRIPTWPRSFSPPNWQIPTPRRATVASASLSILR